MKLRGFLTGVFLLVLLTVSAQHKMTVEQYIHRFKEIARNEMIKSGIPASIKLGQGILESGFGNSDLAKNANNHFGIKCHKEWNGNTYHMDDDAANECFRVYKNPDESYLDHTHFLTSRSRYADLFKLEPTDYKSWAEGLQKAGYATNPKYASTLIGLIEKYELYHHDKPGGKEHKPFDSHKHVVNEQSTVLNPHDKLNIKQSEAVFYFNGLKTVRVQESDDLRTVARRYNIPANYLASFNDLDINTEVIPGAILYIQAKKNKAKKEKHLVTNDETMHEISQLYGIKLDALLKRNLLNEGQEPANGETIFMKKKATKMPALRKKETKPVIMPAPVQKEETIEVKKEEEIQQVSEPVIAKVEAPVVTKPVQEVKPVVEKPNEKTVISQPQASANNITHTVEKGDTLYNLSKRYNVTVQEIIQKNMIEDNNIKIGQTLIIK